ncbi:MAG: hypothetical protein M3Z75_33185, partial [Actinomycetota bacterium]|nr:hypothetical protein [Actinomycetota bacterium]
MTEDKAKKNDVRRRMAQTGERYNVARRNIEAAPGPGAHLIGDEETRRIAESFLAASSSWLGGVTWQDIVAGPDAEYKADPWDGTFDPEKIELGDGQRWSWSVTFTDPSGQQKTLSHETVLQGVRALVFGEDGPGADGVRLLRIRQWFTEPAAERRSSTSAPATARGSASRHCTAARSSAPTMSTAPSGSWTSSRTSALPGKTSKGTAPGGPR